MRRRRRRTKSNNNNTSTKVKPYIYCDRIQLINLSYYLTPYYLYNNKKLIRMMRSILLLTVLCIVVCKTTITNVNAFHVASSTSSTTTGAPTIAFVQQPKRTAILSSSSSSLYSTTIDDTTSSTTAKNAAAPLFVDATNSKNIRESVQQYYGKELQTNSDLQTNACCTGDAPPPYIQECIKNIHPTIISKYYGCGLCIPEYNLQNLSILDLGCGAGRDVYIASQLVGPNGKVVGIDMTTEQLAIAKEYQDYHTQKFGHETSNVQFIQGYLEQLDTISELQKESFDVIISNCVINLCTDKLSVLQSCYNLLKPGGEMYFSDVYASRRVPQSLRDDPVLYGECLSGALYWNDFINMAIKVGFIDPRLVDDAPITIANRTVQETIDNSGYGGIEFYSATYRLWKLPENVLEPECEDYGQAVVYKGTIPNHPTYYKLDKGHVFEKGRMFPVCGNTYNMLYETIPNYKDHFEFYGTFDNHYGIFEGCGTSIPFSSSSSTSSSSSSSSGASCC